jgi:hypothetical protein
LDGSDWTQKKQIFKDAYLQPTSLCGSLIIWSTIWNLERFLPHLPIPNSLTAMLATTLTPGYRPLPCEQLGGLEEEAEQQGDNMEEQGWQEALVSIVKALCMIQASVLNLTAYA